MRYSFTTGIPILAIICLVLFFPTATFAQAGAISTAIEHVLWMFVANVFGWLAGIGGLIMNAGVNTFVVEFGQQYRDGGLGFVIDSLWVVVRDIFNLFFIFGLVYIGFKMILRSDDSNTKRWLVSLILAALLVNFSLFITKAVIDFSNLMATQIVQAGFGIDASAGPNGYKYNISGTFLTEMNLVTVFSLVKGSNAGSPPDFANSANGAGFGYIFGTAFILIIAAFVFAAGGIMLMIRFVALNFFMLLSPFMFIGWVFPPLQRYTSMYWQGFLGRAFFAPVYVLLIYFAYRVLTGFGTLTNQGAKMGNLFGGGGAVTESFSSVFVPFLLTGFFLLAAIVAAQKMSADGASATMRVGNNLTNRGKQALQRTAGAATFGMAARGARSTVGVGARAYTQSDFGKKYSAKSGIAGIAGRAAMAGATKAADSSLDVRKVGGLGKAVGIGEGRKGGVTTIVKEKEKRDEELMKTLEVDTNSEAGKAKVRTEQEKLVKEAERAEKTSSIAIEEVRAAKTIGTDRFVADISALEKEIGDLKNNLSKDEANKTKTETELLRDRELIAEKENRLNAKKALASTNQTYNEKKSKIIELTQEENRLPDITLQDKQNHAKLLAEREALEKEVREINNSLANNEELLKTQVKEAKNQITNSAAIANANVRYANQLTYMNTLESNQKFFSNLTTRGTAAAGGIVAGKMGAGAGVVAGSVLGVGASLAAVSTAGAGGMIGMGAMQQQAELNAASLANLRKKYGRTAMEIAKNQQSSAEQKRIIDELARQMKDNAANTTSAPETGSESSTT